MTALNLAVGLVLLCLGRRLFWLFVGAAGFVTGLLAGQELLQGRPEWVGLLVALLAGIIGALLAVFLQKLAIAAAGFLFGGYVLMSLALAVGNAPLGWLAFLIGGIVGAVLVLAVFDWALIILSSLAGATLVVGSFAMERGTGALLFLVLAIIGSVIQAMPSRRPAEGPKVPARE